MKSLGQLAHGARLERMHASPLWADAGFRNQHPIAAGLRDASVPMPTLRELLWPGGRRVPRAPLPASDPRPPGCTRPKAACAPPGWAAPPCCWKWTAGAC